VPIEYKIDVPLALIMTRCVGHITVGDVLGHFRELARVWPNIDRLDVLLDLTELTSLPTVIELEKVATEIDTQIGPHRFGRCAVVTDRDLVRDSMHMFEVLVNRFFEEIRVFRTLEGAVEWLAPKPNPNRALTRQ
jgi:SpoIIAA-like